MPALPKASVRSSSKVRFLPQLFLLASILVASVMPALASQVRRLNLEQMSQRASRIFHGHCLSITVGVDPALGQKVTVVTFAPYRSLKGGVHGKLKLKLLGDQTPGAATAEATEGIPRFEEGEDVVLFLYGDSGSGLTSPVGFGQGKFKVIPDKSHRLQAVNGFANERLLQGLSPAAQGKLGARAQRLEGRKALPLDDLLEMVQVLVGRAQ